MKKTVLIAALLTLPFVAGCKKQLFHLTGAVNINEVYVLNDNDGTFEDSSGLITRSQIIDELNLPDRSAITGVQIESISIDIARKLGNNATSASVTGEIKVGNTGSWIPVFKDFTVQLQSPHTVINSYNNTGVALLKTTINSYFNFINIYDESIAVRVSGSSSPAPLKVDLTLNIKGTVNYDTCLEVPEWFSGGEECTLE